MNKFAQEFQLKFDEINALTTTSYKSARERHGDNDAEVAREVIDDIMSMMINGYALGVRHVCGMLDLPIGGGDPKFFADGVRKSELTEKELDDLEEALFVVFDGGDFTDRVEKHVREDQPGRLKVLAETEYHRMYNTGGLNTAKDAGDGVTKTWYTQLDDRVRETHEFLESVSVGIEENFHTIDGDEAPAPGMFHDASNNVNCRCIVIYGHSGLLIDAE